MGLIKEKEAIYAKPDFSEEDGLIAADLEIKFEEMNGWNANQMLQICFVDLVYLQKTIIN